MKIFFALLLSLAILPAATFAMGSKPKPPTDPEVLEPGEPSYCDPKTFLSLEKSVANKSIGNAHMFKLGDVTVLGAAVGNSDTDSLISYAKSASTAGSSDKYCTWYLNEGNGDAEDFFTHIYMTNPKDLNTSSGPQEYRRKLSQEFATARTSFLSCASKHKYLAMGCNGMKHRGPTVFGMMLAYSGCKPERASTIVNTLWGLNGVKPEVRLAIIREAKSIGDTDPGSRNSLQEAFGY